mmetsp:Transcript_118848/g.341246  ORF Transcript_118848/g.341246 Transcript_118848/m.341246 type:complete len:204 (+) Transcript_118848:265-876(+)
MPPSSRTRARSKNSHASSKREESNSVALSPMATRQYENQGSFSWKFATPCAFRGGVQLRMYRTLCFCNAVLSRASSASPIQIQSSSSCFNRPIVLSLSTFGGSSFSVLPPFFFFSFLTLASVSPPSSASSVPSPGDAGGGEGPAMEGAPRCASSSFASGDAGGSAGPSTALDMEPEGARGRHRPRETRSPRIATPGAFARARV